MKLLQPAINCGLAESDFWDMTKAEIERYMEGAAWRIKMRAQFDYKLADLLSFSVARVISENVHFPTLQEAYPDMFDEDTKQQEEKIKEAKMESSINNFLAFAQKHNAKISKGVETKKYDD